MNGAGTLDTRRERLALPLFEALDEEVATHHLEQWEPALAAQLLRALYRCQRRVADRRGAPPEAAGAAEAIYRRLCRVDPVAAAGLD